jgi:hypothetical protein
MFLPLDYIPIPGGTYFARPRISPSAEESNAGEDYLRRAGGLQ